MKHIEELGHSLKQQDKDHSLQLVDLIEKENHHLDANTKKILADLRNDIQKEDFKHAFEENWIKFV